MAFAAMALMATVAFLLPKPQDILCLGLGAGTVPSFLRDQAHIHTDVLEIDEGVIHLAHRHFLVGAPSSSAGGATMQEDALQWVDTGPSPAHRDALSSDGRYDLVLSDLWCGGNEGAALTRPFFAAIRERWGNRLIYLYLSWDLHICRHCWRRSLRPRRWTSFQIRS